MIQLAQRLSELNDRIQLTYIAQPQHTPCMHTRIVKTAIKRLSTYIGLLPEVTVEVYSPPPPPLLHGRRIFRQFK